MIKRKKNNEKKREHLDPRVNSLTSIEAVKRFQIFKESENIFQEKIDVKWSMKWAIAFSLCTAMQDIKVLYYGNR